MRISITFYGSFREAVGEKLIVYPLENETTVGDLFSALIEEYPELRGKLLTSTGELPSYVNVAINDESIRLGDGLRTELGDGDDVRLVHSIRGG